MNRKPLGEKGMKSITQRKDQKQVLEDRKEIEKIKHMREKREKENQRKRKQLQKELAEIMKKYTGLQKMLSKTKNKEELKVYEKHKKDLDKDYKKILLQLTRIR